MKSGNERFHEGTGLSDGEGGMKQELTGEDEEDDEGKIEAEDWFRPRAEIEREAAMSESLRDKIDRMGPRRQEAILNQLRIKERWKRRPKSCWNLKQFSYYLF